MARKGKRSGAAWTRAAHIKKGTKGFSNEISISVLDAAKNELESQHGEVASDALGSIKLFTGSSTNATVTLAGEPLTKKEPAPEKKKKARKAPQRHFRSGSTGKASSHAVHSNKERKKRHFEASSGDIKPKKIAKLSTKKSLASAPRKSAKDAKPKKTLEEKVAARKARRRIEGVVLAASLVVVFVVSVVVGFNMAYDNYKVQQGKIAVLDDGVAQISLADETLAELNEALADSGADNEEERLLKLKEELPQTKITLQRAEALLEKGEEGLTDSRDKELVYQAKSGIEARQRMIESGSSIIDKMIPALAAQSTVDSYWNEFIVYDNKARTETALLLNPTGDNLRKALEGIEDVKEGFAVVKSKMTKAEKEYSYVDLTQFKKYIDMRIEALSGAQEAISALLDEDLEKARKKQDEYSYLDEAAAEEAKKLPAKPSETVNSLYQKDVKDDIDAYTQARTDAGVADGKLRKCYS